jgi:hypothetical protein
MPTPRRLLRSLLIALAFYPPVISIAGGPGSVQGQSERFLVRIGDVFPFDGATLVVHEMKEGDDEYSTQRWSVPFPKECKATENDFTCRANGRTVLAGATYKKTLDATPECPGQVAEYRYTCIKGCANGVPKYLKISPYGC